MQELNQRKYWPNELAFSIGEYQQKLEGYQADLKRKKLFGALIFDPENMFWLTGYQTIGYFTFQLLYVPLSGLPILITRIVNADLALALSTIADVKPIYDTDDAISVVCDFLNQEVSANSNLGLETQSWYLKVHEYRQLVECCSNKFVDHDGYIQQQRIIKNARANKADENCCKGSGNRH